MARTCFGNANGSANAPGYPMRRSGAPLRAVSALPGVTARGPAPWIVPRKLSSTGQILFPRSVRRPGGCESRSGICREKDKEAGLDPFTCMKKHHDDPHRFALKLRR